MKPWAILYDETSLALERLYGLVSAQTPILCLPFAQADQAFFQSHHIIHLGSEENCPPLQAAIASGQKRIKMVCSVSCSPGRE